MKHTVSIFVRSIPCLSGSVIAFWVIVILLGSLSLGCSGKPDLDFGKVVGQVTFGGEPLANATVCFTPENGRPSYAKTDQVGSYTILYRGEDWGALTGTHAVKITTADRIENIDTGTVESFPEILPAKYHAKSTLTAKVTEGVNEINFALEK